MRRTAVLLLGIGLAVALGGCVAYGTGLTGSTKPLNPGGYTTIGPTSGSSWGFYLLNLIPISQPGHKTALEKAIRDGGGDALIQATTTVRIYTIPILGTLMQTQVEGTAVRSTR